MIDTCSSLTLAPDMRPGARTDHLRKESHCKTSTWRYVHHAPRRHAHILSTQRSAVDKCRRAWLSICVRDTPRPHRSRKLHQPCQGIQSYKHQDAWPHSLQFLTCTLFCHIVHKWAIVARSGRSSRKHETSAFSHTYRSPLAHCTVDRREESLDP